MVSTFTNLDYQVGKYFKVREFQSKDGYPTVLIDDNLVDLLDQIENILENLWSLLRDIARSRIMRQLEVYQILSIRLEKPQIYR